MAAFAFDALVDHLREERGDDLRWVASFDSDRFTYKVRYVRDDLKTDLTDRQLQIIIHRSMAVFNRDHVEDVYYHLGDAQALVVQHEEATAVHLYLDDRRGVVVKLAADAEIPLPGFVEACLDALGA
ncbi:hypothetical protein ACFQH6_04255 [Halobacteriaceae archaeon GCM10025711]